MTIRITRLRRQHYGTPLLVLLDERPVGQIAPGASGDIKGNGRVQQLRVTSAGFVDSPSLPVTDPGRDLLLGVLVTYTKDYKLFRRSTKTLNAEIMGPPISLPTDEDPKR
jgi:hypothetical protein